MSEHRFRGHFEPNGTIAAPPATAEFVAAPSVPPAAAATAEVYRLAYEAAIARVVARRRCFAPFSTN